MSPLLGLIIILICVALEGFFSGSELALVSADRVAIRARKGQTNRSAELLARFLEDPERILTATLIGTNLCVVTSTTVFALLLSEVGDVGGTDLSQHSELWTVLLLSPLLLFFGELLPKSVYRVHADRIAPVVIYPLTWLSVGLFPLVSLIRSITVGLLRLLGTEEHAHMGVSRDELRLLLRHRQGGEIEQEERKMISRIFDFPEITAKEVMCPLIDLVAIDEGQLLREAAELFVESGFSRLPVFHGRVDDIVGVLSAKDVLVATDLEVPVSTLKRPVTYAAEGQKVEILLTDLQSRGEGVAIVVDEYGGAEGMVTVEDILEEIVGEIEDEHDEPVRDVLRRGKFEYLVSARTEVDHLEEVLPLSLPDGDYETLGGFLLEQFGRIPELGDRCESSKAVFTVVKANARAIEEVQVVLLDPPEEEEE